MRIDVARNAKRNILVGIISRIILLIMPFVVRTAINSVLGAEYLGLNSLFTSIISVLSLTELGFSSALVYHMYKPIAENDFEKIKALLNLYKRAYRIIGFIILVIGAFITPFIPRLIKGTYPTDINVFIMFAIYILNTSISYLMFGYKQSLLVAYQREDLNSLINLFVQVGMQIVQMVFLVITHNFYFFVICMPIFTVLNNLWIGHVTKKIFPKLKAEGTLDRETLNSIKLLIAGTFIQKACELTRNSLDSICISAFLGLTITAIYNNYYTVIYGVISLLSIFSTSLMGGIGNHVSIKTVEENYAELKKVDFLYMTVSGICTACFLCLFQSFMKIWMGQDMVLPFEIVCLLCFYFYLLKTGDMRSMYSVANGLWWIMRYRSIIETLLNLTLNIILGRLFGVYGIVIATIISLFSCNFLWSTRIVFNSYFDKKRLTDYYRYHFVYALCTLAVCFVCYFITNCLIIINNPYIDFIVKAVVTVIVSLSIYFIVYNRTNIFRKSIMLLKK